MSGGERCTSMWFGNLVTMKWWNDIWLNEGFANLVEFYGADYLYPRLDLLNLHLLYGWSQAIQYDSMNNSHSLSHPVNIYPMIDELFDPISYNKGSSILRMLESTIGPKNFINGLRANTNLKLKTVMDSWINHRSFPLVQVDIHSQNAVVTQISYLKAKVEDRAKRDNIDPLEWLKHFL
ncbi:hypothetical protein HZS_1949 [Henneguya salminicola]|nr:hypothetical protein HZS_1949 [Henneguya salminicola]